MTFVLFAFCYNYIVPHMHYNYIVSHLHLLQLCYVELLLCPSGILSNLYFVTLDHVPFEFCYICIMSHLHFVTSALCIICILLHLHFVSFAFCYICILLGLHFVCFWRFATFAFCQIRTQKIDKHNYMIEKKWSYALKTKVLSLYEETPQQFFYLYPNPKK